MQTFSVIAVFNEDRSVIEPLIIRITGTVSDDKDQVQHYVAEPLSQGIRALPHVPEDDRSRTWRFANDAAGNKYRVDASYDDTVAVYKLKLFPVMNS